MVRRMPRNRAVDRDGSYISRGVERA